MARSVLEIILSLKGDKARKELAKVDKSFSKVDKSAKKSGNALKQFDAKMALVAGGAGLATAGVVKLGQAIWNMGKRGAAVEQTGESFDFLLKKLEVAPDLLADLQKEFKGTVDDMTIMSSIMTLTAGTTDDLSKAFIDAAPQLAKIAKAANKLNPTMGDTAFMFDSITAGIKRNSKLVLDNLGIVFSSTEAQKNYAQSIGKTVDQLTENELVQSTLNAALKAGANLINQVGNNVDAAGDAMARSEVALKNLTDQWSTFVAVQTTKVAPTLTDILGGINENLSSQDMYNQAMDKGIIQMGDYTEAVRENNNTNFTAAEMIEWLTEKTEEYNEKIERVTSGLEYSKEAQRDFNWEMLEGVEATDDLTVSMEDLGLAAAGTKDAIEGLEGVLSGVYASALKASTDSVYELERAKLVMKLATKDLSQAEIEHALNMLDSIDRVETLTQAVSDDEVSQRDLRLAIMDGIVTADEYNSMMGIMADAIDYAAIKAYYLRDGLAAASGDWNATFTLDIVQRGGSMADLKKLGITGAAAARAIEEGTEGPDYQHGGSFIVPPGYTNIGFPMQVHTGEHVSVTPAGQKHSGGNIYTQNVTQVFNNEEAAALGLAVVRKFGRDRLNASMGR